MIDRMHFNVSGIHGLPEVPTFISVLNDRFGDDFWVQLLHQWENIIFALIASLIVVVVFFIGTRKKQLVPSGLQNVLETLTEALSKFVVEILGPGGEKYVPFLGSLFVYILTMNLLGLIPLMKSPTASMSITFAHALCVFILVQFLSIRNMGFFGYMYHLMGQPKSVIQWIMVPLLFPIELLMQVTRPVTLAIRLFGNIFGEEILIGFAAFFAVTLLPIIYPAALPLQTPLLFLILFTGLIQALVFTLLTTIYILLSMPHIEEDHTS